MRYLIIKYQWHVFQSFFIMEIEISYKIGIIIEETISNVLLVFKISNNIYLDLILHLLNLNFINQCTVKNFYS